MLYFRPLLFIIYIDDIVKQVEHCTINLYADYPILYFSDKYINRIECIIYVDLKRIHARMCLNKLTLKVE